MSSQTLMYVLVPHANGIASGPPQQVAPLAAARVNGGEQGILLVAATVLNGGGSGFPVSILGLSDDADNVAPLDGLTTPLFEGVVSRNTVYDPFTGVTGEWNRMVAASDNVDAQQAFDTFSLLATAARSQFYNGVAGYNRARDATAANMALLQGRGSQLMTGPGEWAINQAPAAATQATVTRAAAGAGVRHVCKSITVSIAAVAAQGAITFNLRDGASGAGTILWTVTLIAPAGNGRDVTIGNLNIVGSANTAMTLESAVAPAATNFATVAMTGYDAVAT